MTTSLREAIKEGMRSLFQFSHQHILYQRAYSLSRWPCRLNLSLHIMFVWVSLSESLLQSLLAYYFSTTTSWLLLFSHESNFERKSLERCFSWCIFDFTLISSRFPDMFSLCVHRNISLVYHHHHDSHDGPAWESSWAVMMLMSMMMIIGGRLRFCLLFHLSLWPHRLQNLWSKWEIVFILFFASTSRQTVCSTAVVWSFWETSFRRLSGMSLREESESLFIGIYSIQSVPSRVYRWTCNVSEQEAVCSLRTWRLWWRSCSYF